MIPAIDRGNSMQGKIHIAKKITNYKFWPASAMAKISAIQK